MRVQAVWGKRSLQLSIETRHAVQMVNMWGRHGCEARVLALRIVKPRPYPRPGDKLKSEEEEEEGGPTVPDSEVLGVIRVKVCGLASSGTPGSASVAARYQEGVRATVWRPAAWCDGVRSPSRCT